MLIYIVLKNILLKSCCCVICFLFAVVICFVFVFFRTISLGTCQWSCGGLNEHGPTGLTAQSPGSSGLEGLGHVHLYEEVCTGGGF